MLKRNRELVLHSVPHTRNSIAEVDALCRRHNTCPSDGHGIVLGNIPCTSGLLAYDTLLVPLWEECFATILSHSDSHNVTIRGRRDLEVWIERKKELICHNLTIIIIFITRLIRVRMCMCYRCDGSHHLFQSGKGGLPQGVKTGMVVNSPGIFTFISASSSTLVGVLARTICKR